MHFKCDSEFLLYFIFCGQNDFPSLFLNGVFNRHDAGTSGTVRDKKKSH